MANYARSLIVADGVVAAIQFAARLSAPDQVQRLYELPITENDLLITGKQVYVFPDAFQRLPPIARNLYLNEYKIRVVVAERYTAGPGPAPQSWVDARVNWVAQYAIDAIDFAIDSSQAQGLLLNTLWTETIEVIELYAPDLLAQNKLFFSEILLAYREESLP